MARPKLDREQFAAHLVEFAESHWSVFVEFSRDYDYDEKSCEEGCKAVRKAAGQSA